MGHSLSKIWIHALFSTKNRQPIIETNATPVIYAHIEQHLKSLDCFCRNLNGTNDHLHVLFLLNATKSVAEVIKNVKGESSHWINQQTIVPERFAWQTGYGAFSVSESVLAKVDSYIKNQQEHHKNMTFQQEYERFILLHGLVFDESPKTVKTVENIVSNTLPTVETVG